MKKLDNFSNCLDVLKGADFDFAKENDIYRTGVIGQFNLTFELAWKALQAVLRVHGADGAETGSRLRLFDWKRYLARSWGKRRTVGDERRVWKDYPALAGRT